jgi:YHS domain-containing protein
VHAQKLKEHFIEFDRVLQLTDTSEENAGAEVKARMVEKDLHYSWEAEQEKVAKTIEGIKAGFGEDLVVSEINATGSIEEVTRTIRKDVDPFYLRVDDPEANRANADLGEEEKRLPKSDFGSYCPVTYVNDNFLQKGNPEFECTIFGKTFTFAGEKELEDFKLNPIHYLSNLQLPLQPPMPKVMVIGQKGAGITTQVNMLCDKYKLSTITVKE